MLDILRWTQVMYWPLGAPRVYAVNKLRKTSAPASDEDQSGNESVVEDNVIRGLEVSRNGHLFATITQTSLTIWQTSVSCISFFVYWF